MKLTIERTNTILYCQNWQACVDFYNDIIKLPVNFKNHWFVEFCITEQSFLSVANISNATLNSSSEDKSITLSFLSNNLNQWHQYFCDAGLEPTDIKKVWQSNAFYIFDPDSHRIEFWQPV